MNLKKAMLERIERNSIKVDVDGESVYLKKKNGWHLIYPPIDMSSVEKATDENGNIDWKKVKWDKTALIFGNKSNAIKSSVVAIITLLLIFGVWQVIASYNQIALNPIVQGCLKQAGVTLGI